MKPDLKATLLEKTAAAAATDLEQAESELGNDELETDRVTELNDAIEAVVEGVASASDALIEDGQTEGAETLLIPLLRAVRTGPGVERLERTLEGVDKGTTPAFNAALAGWLSHRPTAAFSRFGGQLNADALGNRARAELGELLARLWREATEEEGDDGASRALVAVGELHRNGVAMDLDHFTAEITGSFSSGVGSQEGVERMGASLDLLKKVEALGLISAEAVADLVLALAELSLVEPPAEGQAEAVVSFLRECFVDYADNAPEERLASSREALAESPWIASQSPDAEIIHLQLAGVAQAAESVSPYSPAKIGELVAGHGQRFIPGAILWLERFEPPPGQVGKALRPLLYGTQSVAFRQALAGFSKRQDARGRYRLVKNMIEWPARVPPQSTLRALGIRAADPDSVSAAIVERYRRSPSNPEREAALRIWRAFDPPHAKHRRMLIQRVFIPLCRHGAGGYDLCRKYLELCADPPRGTKSALRSALVAAPDKKRLRKMRKRMKEVGL